MKVLVKTKDFVDEFAQFEIEDYYQKKFKVLEKGFYELDFKEEKELFDFVYNMTYFSRVIENVYLKIDEFKIIEDLNKLGLDFIKKDFTFEVDALNEYKLDHKKSEIKLGELILNSNKKLSVDLSKPDLSFKLFSKNNTNYLALDLIGFNLSKRDYKINNNSKSINTLLVNYALYLLKLDEFEDKYSIIDPASHTGDIIIESASFNKRKPIHIKKRHELPIKKLFSILPKMQNKIEDKNKYLAVVQNNKIFKELKENLSASGNSNVKVSQYELDWLDVKFQEASCDFIISQIPTFQDEKEREYYLTQFFYQVEFIVNEAICVISKKEINKKYFKKQELEIEEEKEVFIGEQQYWIYVLI